MKQDRATVHLAGPDCSPEEDMGMRRLAALLERDGFEVYLPSRDGIESVFSDYELPGVPGTPDPLDGGPGHRSVLQSAAFALEIYRLAYRCDCLVFNMNGRVPDDGGAFSAAVAFTLGRPVILYKRDHRTKLAGSDNAMITGLSFDFSTVGEASKLPDAVKRAVEHRPGAGRLPRGMPPLVKVNADLGREVAESLECFKGRDPKAGLADLYTELAASCHASEVFRLRTRTGT